jgi:hypothetical protein
MKYTVKNKTEVGKNGPGVYVYPDGKDTRGKQKRKVVTVTGETKTEQAHKKQCDMNHILRNYQKTGLIQHAKKYEGTYDDITVQDFQEAMFKVQNAMNMYEELPSNIRERFNGPEAFIAFTNDPANAPEMQRMGILPGNDGLKADSTPSGAPTPTDKNGDGVPDKPPA